MKALITGASSGIGYEMAKYLSTKNVELILVGRNKEQLSKLQKEIKTKTSVIIADISDIKKLKEIYVLTKNENIDILINNAGFGEYGYFSDMNIDIDTKMIGTNIYALMFLTKSFLQLFEKKGGYILNVASSAAFAPGPMMAEYYATKSYVYSLTEAIYYEQKQKNNNVHISVLCPGPVNTNFNKTAKVKFNTKPMSAEYVAKYAIDQMFKNKFLIIPGTKMKAYKFLTRFLSDKARLKLTNNSQEEGK